MNTPSRRPNLATQPPTQTAHALPDALRKLGIATDADLEAAMARGVRERRAVGDVLCEQLAMEPAVFYPSLAAAMGLQYVTYAQAAALLERDTAEEVARAFLERHFQLPLRMEGETLLVATCQPDPASAELARALKAERVRTLVVTHADLRMLWARVDGLPVENAGAGAAALSRSEQTAEPVDVVESWLARAVAERASDLHLERTSQGIRIRLRVDGSLRDLERVEVESTRADAIVSVIKVQSRLDIAERRAPQSGRVRRAIDGHVHDLRVQTQPTVHGENVVIRIRPEDSPHRRVTDLGFPEDLSRELQRLFASPAGLLLVVGPTGSGKTTTLYAGVRELAHDTTRKVITVEDPVEFMVEGAQQSDAQPDAGFRFADAVRAFVRQDPDVILVGEIRDAETALEAIRAAQTGHLVLSTLHCNDAVDAVQRLLDLGCHPNSVATNLLAIVSQQLVRRNCPNCRREVAPEPEILGELFPEGLPVAVPCMRGDGCDACGGYGTRGMIPAVEYLRAGPAIRKAIARRLPADELRRIALAHGLRTLRDSLLQLVTSGVIPLSEIPTVLPYERMAGEHA